MYVNMRTAAGIICIFLAFSSVCSERADIESEESVGSEDEGWQPTKSPVSGDDDVAETTYSTPLPQANQTTTCPNCDSDEARNLRLAFIKREIMERLGMKHAPTVNGSRGPSLQLVHHLLDHELHDDFDIFTEDSGKQRDQAGSESEKYDRNYFVTAKRIIVFAKKMPYSSKPHSSHTAESFFFKFSQNVLENEITAARLWVYVKPRVVLQDTTTTVKVFRLQSRDRNKEKRVLIESRKIDVIANSGGWQSFNLTSVVQDWFEAMWTNWGIEVEAVDHAGHSILTPRLYETHSKKPFLEIRTHSHSRKRRSVSIDCPANIESFRGCCRHPLTVNFRELGIDFVIRPKQYQAYYCTGECEGLLTSHHSHANFMSRLGIDRCCSPTEMSRLSLLYFDDDSTIIHGDIPNMVVQRCGCS